MNELVTREDIKIENMIYEIRGKEVMLDSDLAMLYGCANGTKTINQAVKRNSKRFPSDFYFELTSDEMNDLQSRIGTANTRINNMSRTLPKVFTEQGVAMLATVIHTQVATEVSVNIMRAFVTMRKYISSNNYEKRLSNIETKIIEYDSKFNLVMDKLSSKVVNNHIFFEGQIYDAYSLMLDIFETSKESIIILDNYTDKKLLDILSKTNKDITIYSKNMDIELIKKYQIQYNNITIKYNDSFHDRFIIIDNKTLYHCGSSFKDLGKKCFAINKIENSELLGSILKIL